MRAANQSYTGISLPRALKIELRVEAAKNGMSMARFARRLIESGLEEYREGRHLDTTAGQAQETTSALRALANKEASS